MKREDEPVIGARFGHWTVIGRDDARSRYWMCRCDCGNIRSIRKDGLISGRTSSCGCITYNFARTRLIGKHFGKLTVLEYDHTDDHGDIYWLCECECGNVKVVCGDCLIRGSTKTCGCGRSEWAIKRNTTHGMSGTRIHYIWSSMIQRCHSDDFRTSRVYKSRGICVCEEWENFENFYQWALNNGYEDNLTIDRINNDKGYYPENCRWVDIITQANNRRTNRIITYFGISHTVAEWGRLFDIPYDRFLQRINRGDMHDFEEYFGEADPNWHEG